MKIDREKLVKALNSIMPAVGKSDSATVFQCVEFSKLSLAACDGVVTISTQMHKEANPGVSCFVPAQQLLTLLHSIPDDKVSVEHKGSLLVVKSNKGKIKGKFTVVDEKKHIAVPEFKTTNNSKKLSVFMDAINFCRYNVSHDDTDGQYCGVRLDGAKVMSTDRYRLSMYSLENKVVGKPCTVPVEFINLMLKHRSDVLNVRLQADIGKKGTSDKFVVCLKGGTVMHTSLLAGDYHNIEEDFPDGGTEFTFVEFPETIKSVLNRHIEFLRGATLTSKYIEVTIDGKICNIVSRTENGDLEERVDLLNDVDVDKFGFHIDPAFWKDVCAICYEFNYSEGRILFLTERLSYLCQEAVEVD